MLAYKVNDKNIAALVQMDLVSLRQFFETIDFDARTWLIAKPIVKEIIERLQFMIDVGVGYLNLDRVARVLKIFGMVNCTPQFENHPEVIDGCTE